MRYHHIRAETHGQNPRHGSWKRPEPLARRYMLPNRQSTTRKVLVSHVLVREGDFRSLEEY